MSEQTEFFPDDSAPAPRARDHAFEALCEAWGVGEDVELTRDQRGRVNAALKQLREVHPELESYELSIVIKQRAANWSSVYPEIALTPQALTAHWASLETAWKAPSMTTNASTTRRR